MDQLTSAAASGLRARLESLDLLANNLANASTTGFKADREFYNLYRSADTMDVPPGSDPAAMPVVQQHWTDFSKGVLESTSNPLDLAIAGNGFFQVISPSGALYTRDGSFRLSPSGQIVTQGGFPVVDQKEKPIKVDPAKSIEVSSDGTIRQEGIDVATLKIADVGDSHLLSKQGQNYFQLSSSNVQTPAIKQPDIQQGKRETANFQPAESAVRLVTIMRQFETLQKAMSIGTDMNRRSVEDVARVS